MNWFMKSLAAGTVVFSCGIFISTRDASANDGSWRAKLSVREGGVLCKISGPFFVNFEIDGGLISGTDFQDDVNWAYSGTVKANNVNIVARSAEGDQFRLSGGLIGDSGAGVWESSAGCGGDAIFKRMN